MAGKFLHTFLKYYLYRCVDKNVHAIVQSLKPQKHMMYTVCQMLQSINLHHSLELISTQLSSVNQLPEIQEFIQKQNKLTKLLGRSIERHTETVKYKLYKQLNHKLAGEQQPKIFMQ
ncbi:hypothetical protein CIHG_10100 [Coccidioides immitis H538.4]|uniref:Uncharacterized protein n=1 Tax=Coccidioides immitis H538.4 TaxID=396776 RepID=A0A0J8UWM4_COCIT|nr:hypothetical protein CIHG_10100 [Coccidioides immitis H538.4]